MAKGALFFTVPEVAVNNQTNEEIAMRLTSTRTRKTMTARTARRTTVKKGRHAAIRRLPQPITGVVVARPVNLEFSDAFGKSPAIGQKFVFNRLTSAGRTDEQRIEDTGELVHWASAPNRGVQRKAMIAAYRQSKSEIVLIHKLSELPGEQLDTFIKEYFAAGGSLAPVIRWMQLAGAAIRGGPVSGRRRNAVRGRTRAIASRGFGDWLKGVGNDLLNIGKKGVDAVSNAISSLANAVIKAGKSLGQMVNEAVSWTVGELTDLVEALVRAGKRVADILAAAAAKSIDQLKKYVEALLNAGRSVAELMAWATGQVLNTANAVVAKLIALGRTVLDIVKSVLSRGRNALVPALRGVIAAGKRVFDVLAAFANEVLAVVQPLIDALLALGRTLREVLVEAAKLAATACRTVVSALLNLGRTVTQLLVDAANALGTTLMAIAGALLALGQRVAQLLAAVATQAANVMKALVGVLIALGKKLADVVLEAVTQTAAVVKAALGALLALGYKVIDILFTLAGRALSAIRMVLEALLAMGVALGALVADICTGIAAEFRKGFFEGLVALGKAPLQILKAAFEFKASLVLLALPVIFEMFGGYRQLTRDELREAQIIFGASIDLDRVKVGFAKLPHDVLDYVNIQIPRAFTTMYLINFGPGAVLNMNTMIHELTHVWQGVQAGPLYMTRALEAQIGAGVKSLWHTGRYDDSAAYVATPQQLRDNQGDFSKFNPEQQAQIVEDFWRYTRGGVSDPNSRTAALRPYARAVFTPIRAGARAAARRGTRARRRTPALA